MRSLSCSAMNKGAGINGEKYSISFSKVMRLKGKERDEPSQCEALLRGWGWGTVC